MLLFEMASKRSVLEGIRCKIYMFAAELTWACLDLLQVGSGRGANKKFEQGVALVLSNNYELATIC